MFRCKAWLDSLCVCVCLRAHVQALCAMCSWAGSSFCIRLQAPGQSVRACLCDKSLQSCPTLCDPRGFGPPGSSIRGILQARILEWIALSSSRGSSRPRDQNFVSCVSCIGRWILSFFLLLYLIFMFVPVEKELFIPVERQKHYFADKGLSSQGYGFSSIYVWM